MDKFLSDVIDAHGGLDRWRKVKSLDVTFNYWGALLELKGYPGHRQPIVSIDPTTPRVVFQRLDGDPDNRWIFTTDRVWIERRDGTILEARDNPRAAFDGHKRTTPWDRLHLLYFIGYAMWNYITVPFLFSWDGFVVRELEPHIEAGESWRAMEVTYPDGIPAHTKAQTLYFDQGFMLKRLDYVTDILGGVGAHYTFDPITVEGLVFPSLRRVVRRNPEGPLLSGKTSFLLDYTEVVIRTA